MPYAATATIKTVIPSRYLGHSESQLRETVSRAVGGHAELVRFELGANSQLEMQLERRSNRTSGARSGITDAVRAVQIVWSPTKVDVVQTRPVWV